MQVAVTFRHIEATDALRRHAEEKVERALKFVRRPIEAHVILSVTKRRHRAEITLLGDQERFVATEETEDLYSAIDLAMSKIESQARKHATRRQDRKHASPPPGAAAEPDGAAGSRRRLDAERVTVELMSIGEALGQLRQSEHGFLLFQNSASEALSIVYRKKDGSYGLIEPEGL